MSGLLTGKTAVVTGASSGIGRTTAETFVREGASVVLADIDEAAGSAFAAELGDRAHFVRTDVTSEHQVEALVAQAVAQFGELHVLFSNAGAGGDQSPVAELAASGLDQVLALNLRSHVFAHKHALRQMLQQGGGGSIVTTSSVAGLQAGWGAAAYSIAKAGVLGLVRSTALEARGTGVRSNAIAPGGVVTPLFSRYFAIPAERTDEFLTAVGQVMGQDTLIGRGILPEDVANAALFLASDQSAAITGTVLPVDGGATAVTNGRAPELVAEVAQQFTRG
jgi:NAD(P)-dependent dehydrogenase (short-subunit alcohol dehydrogenase family)